VCGVVVGAALLLAGCGDDGDDAATSANEQAPPVSLEGRVTDHGTEDLGDATTLEMELDDEYFAPTFVNAPAGATVTVTLHNEGDLPHTFTIDDLGIDEQLSGGQTKTVEVTLPDSGNAAFYCRFHVSSGMQGAFVVSGASEGQRPAATSMGGAVPGY